MDRAIATPAGIEINDSGKSIRINFMYKGTRCRETMKMEPTKNNIKYCAGLRTEILNKIARNEFDYKEYFPESKLAKRLGLIKEIKSIKCKDLFEEQLIYYNNKLRNGNMSPGTVETYTSSIKHILIPEFGEYDITKLDMQAIKNWVSSQNICHNTINKYLAPLKNMIVDALEGELIEENPIKPSVLKKVIQMAAKKSDYKVEPFTEVEKDMILNTATGQLKNLFQFGFWSGLRIGKLIALKWVDIDFENKVANICRAKSCGKEKGTKTSSGVRTLFLLPKAFKALENQLAYTQGCEHVFHNPRDNKQWRDTDAVSHKWRITLSSITSIKYRNCYQMRHTYASTLLSNGENPAWIANQMGHANLDTVFKRYGRWIPKKNGYKFVGNYE